MTRKEKAMQSFLDGYNCSQCLVLAFEDLLTIDIDTALKIAAPFGGGMGRLREVCGSVSGMFMVFGFSFATPRTYDAFTSFFGINVILITIKNIIINFIFLI